MFLPSWRTVWLVWCTSFSIPFSLTILIKCLFLAVCLNVFSARLGAWKTRVMLPYWLQHQPTIEPANCFKSVQYNTLLVQLARSNIPLIKFLPCFLYVYMVNFLNLISWVLYGISLTSKGLVNFVLWPQDMSIPLTYNILCDLLQTTLRTTTGSTVLWEFLYFWHQTFKMPQRHWPVYVLWRPFCVRFQWSSSYFSDLLSHTSVISK